jgi:Na+-driven multidrug efflux pump
MGMLVFFMLGGALRSTGDARTPMVLGIVMTILNIVFNVVLIRGLGAIPAFGTLGSAMGTSIASGLIAAYAFYKLWSGKWVVSFPRGSYAPDWKIIRQLFKFGLPTGIQGIAMNIGGVLMLSFIGSLAHSAAAQAAFAVSYTQLFSLVTWTSVGLMGAAAAVAGQNLGAGHPERADKAVHVAARYGLAGRVPRAFLFLFPAAATGFFRDERAGRTGDRDAASSCFERLRFVHFRRPYVHRRAAGDGRHQKPSLHFDRFAGRGPARDLLRNSADWDA